MKYITLYHSVIQYIRNREDGHSESRTMRGVKILGEYPASLRFWELVGYTPTPVPFIPAPAPTGIFTCAPTPTFGRQLISVSYSAIVDDAIDAGVESELLFASVVVWMFEADNLLGRGVISGVVCGCDEHWDCAVESGYRVMALCGPM